MGDEEELEAERKQYADYPEKLDMIISSSISSSTYGEELRKEGDKLIELVKKCIQGPEEHEKYKEEMFVQNEKVQELLWNAQIETLREMEKNAKGHEPDLSNKKTQDFLEVMNDVMQRYKGRVAWRLGLRGTMKLKKAVDAME